MGNLILITGFSGSGKSTLVRALLERNKKLQYLRTVTTRKRRLNEDDVEYEFVTEEQYQTLREQSDSWDHTEFNGVSYGADVAHVNEHLSKGINIVCCLAPDINILKDMRKLYIAEPIVIWLDVSQEKARSRIGVDVAQRQARIESDELRLQSMVYKPDDDLDLNKKKFSAFVSELLSNQ